MAFQIVRQRARDYMCLSTDVKITAGIIPGSVLHELDTNVYYIFDGTQWIVQNVLSIYMTTTIDLQQAAGDYTLYASNGTVYIGYFRLTLPNVDVSDDATITSISVQSTMTVPNVIISATQGVKANLTPLKEFIYTGVPFFVTDKKDIELTIAGGAADDPTVCSVAIRYQAVTPTGYLNI